MLVATLAYTLSSAPPRRRRRVVAILAHTLTNQPHARTADGGARVTDGSSVTRLSSACRCHLGGEVGCAAAVHAATTSAVRSQPGSKLGVAPPDGQVRGRGAVLGGNEPDPCPQHHPHDARRLSGGAGVRDKACVPWASCGCGHGFDWNTRCNAVCKLRIDSSH